MSALPRPVETNIDTLESVREEHVYVTFVTPDGIRMLWEFDLLGDLRASSDGAIPPVVHLECPLCTPADNPEERSFLSVTSPNKEFELEEMPEERWVYYLVRPGGSIQETKHAPRREALLDGTRVCVMKRRLTIKQKFSCSYCGASYRLTDNVLSLLR